MESPQHPAGVDFGRGSLMSSDTWPKMCKTIGFFLCYDFGEAILSSLRSCPEVGRLSKLFKFFFLLFLLFLFLFLLLLLLLSRYMHTSLMVVVLTSPYIPTCTLWLKGKGCTGVRVKLTSSTSGLRAVSYFLYVDLVESLTFRMVAEL